MISETTFRPKSNSNIPKNALIRFLIFVHFMWSVRNIFCEACLKQVRKRFSCKAHEMVENNGIEPMTSCVQSRRSPSWANSPDKWGMRNEEWGTEGLSHLIHYSCPNNFRAKSALEICVAYWTIREQVFKVLLAENGGRTRTWTWDLTLIRGAL